MNKYNTNPKLLGIVLTFFVLWALWKFLIGPTYNLSDNVSDSIFFVAAIIVALIVAFIYGLKNKSKINQLQKEGTKLEATIDYIILEVFDDIGHARVSTYPHQRFIFKIHCTYTDPNTQMAHECVSNNLDSEPDVQINSTLIDVYVDKNDSNNYWVDTSKIKFKGPTGYSFARGAYLQSLDIDKYSPGLYKSFDGTAYTKAN